MSGLVLGLEVVLVEEGEAQPRPVRRGLMFGSGSRRDESGVGGWSHGLI